MCTLFTYTPTSIFETFPVAAHSSEAAVDDVAVAAKQLDVLRTGWLDPPCASAKQLAKRTLTNLYNAPPTWLMLAHARLDSAVHAAYGWAYPLADDGVFERLLELNAARASSGVVTTRDILDRLDETHRQNESPV